MERAVGRHTLAVLLALLTAAAWRVSDKTGLFYAVKRQLFYVSLPQAQSSFSNWRRTGKVNVNCATTEVFDALPQTSHSLAQRIVSDRDAFGAFPSIKALQRVKGVGPKKVACWRPIVEAATCHQFPESRPKRALKRQTSN